MIKQDDPIINSQTELQQLLQQIIAGGAVKFHQCNETKTGLIDVVGFEEFAEVLDPPKIINSNAN